MLRVKMASSGSPDVRVYVLVQSAPALVDVPIAETTRIAQTEESTT